MSGYNWRALGNSQHNQVVLGKAGRKRWKGRRPHVRGTAMNPVAHPMGGGEGRNSGGRHPCSPTAVPAKGGNTRKRRKPSSKGNYPPSSVTPLWCKESLVSKSKNAGIGSEYESVVKKRPLRR